MCIDHAVGSQRKDEHRKIVFSFVEVWFAGQLYCVFQSFTAAVNRFDVIAVIRQNSHVLNWFQIVTLLIY